MTEKTNGKWQLAFWMISIFFVFFSTGIVNAVVTNDRLRISEDKEIRECIYEELKDINNRLSKIEGKLEIRTTNEKITLYK